jgi:hypothetical protein
MDVTLLSKRPCSQATKARKRDKSPLSVFRARLRRNDEPVRGVLAEAVGGELAAKVLRAATHAVTFRLRGKGRKEKRSAVCQWAERPVREEDSDCVRGFALYFLSVVEWISSEGSRAMGLKLWRGHGRRMRQQPPTSLASKVGRSPAELARYQAVLRTAGILADWQPRPDQVPAKLVGRRSGHAYACYELCAEVPRVLRQHLLTWWGPQGGAKTAPAVAAAPKPRGPMSEAASAVAAQWAAAHAPPS